MSGLQSVDYRPTTDRASRDVLSLDTPDDTTMGLAALPLPSADLLDRARAGWERFTGSTSAVADE
ncbi:hypothetical protein [Streptomyces sp. W1SF4]|uniref:hypothetical protein n=1 Tax=Streptomyces sp. W1SF4 TaxID=2305220 RepID=UPI000F6DF6E9|nr:hypothetical protein [Streptomyces sp. W1SF4]AZM91423.1 hypothetical protein D1J60_25540 [Streptomyces sp. W1SF4]